MGGLQEVNGPVESISRDEAIQLGAADGVFFSNYFFADDCRQGSPPFHRWLWELFASHRLSNALIFRGGAKTTIARHHAARKIAYGTAHTVLFVSKSEDHAVQSVGWLAMQIEYNEKFRNYFGLRRGNKWTEGDIEIIHGVEKFPIRIKALGIMGSIRGINVKGYRPDTIVCDDLCDEENSSTPEQRNKTSEIFFSGVVETLTPASEDPTASLTNLQTPFHEDDVGMMCAKSRDFATLRVGILDETERYSAWPTRYPREEIILSKQAAMDRNQLSLWMREKMVTITSKETSEFKAEWLKYWDLLPPKAIYIGAIDPAPVMSDAARAIGKKTDLQAVMVAAYWRGFKYVVEYATARDQDPEALSRELERLSRKYPVRRWGVEGVAYQRNLKWYLEREMQAGRLRHLRVVEIPAPRGKHERIVQAHSGRASSGCLYVHSSHADFIQQFTDYPNIKFKDLLDVSAMCDMTITPRQEQQDYIDGTYDVVEDEKEFKQLGDWRASP